MADEINFSKSDARIYEKIEKEIGMFPEVYCFTSDGFQDIMQEITFAFKKKPPKGIFIRHTKQGIRIDISVALFGNCHIALTGYKIQEKIKSIVEELTDELILSIDVAVTQIIK